MTKKFLTLALAALVIAACQPKKTEETTAAVDSAANVMAPAPTAAQLSEEQKAEGWKLLFDGQTTNGWRFYKNKPNNSWEVADGALHCKPFVEGGDNQRADIMTVDQYANFELAFDWKISPQGNSGVMFRVNENHDQPYFSGPEYQVIDDKGYPGDLKDVQLTGADYDMYAASAPMAKPIGEWNSSRLVVNGNHVEHWVNGTKVVEYELGSADWKKRKKASKWKDEADYGVPTTGHIDFQDHDHEVWYKNIMIKTL